MGCALLWGTRPPFVLSAGGARIAAVDVRICVRVRRVGAVGRASAVGFVFRRDERCDAALATAEPTGSARRSGTMRSISPLDRCSVLSRERSSRSSPGRASPFCCLPRRRCPLSVRGPASRSGEGGRTGCRGALRITIAARHLVFRSGHDARRPVRAWPVGAGGRGAPGHAAFAAGGALALRYVAKS